MALCYRVSASLYAAVRCTQQQRLYRLACRKVLIATLTSMILMKLHWSSQLGNARGIGKFRYSDQYLYISKTVQCKYGYYRRLI